VFKSIVCYTTRLYYIEPISGLPLSPLLDKTEVVARVKEIDLSLRLQVSACVVKEIGYNTESSERVLLFLQLKVSILPF
jgi:hypothetical protein